MRSICGIRGFSTLALIIGIGASGVAFTGCGSSPASTSPRSSTASGTETSGLESFLVGSRDEVGFAPSGKLQTASTASAFAAIEDPDASASYTKQLERAGFVEAESESLGGSGGQGISYVIKVASAAKARALAAQQTRTLEEPEEGEKPSVFRVPGPDGAIGVAFSGQPTGANVILVSGDCFALIGNESTGAVPLAKFEPPLVKAAVLVMGRSAGHCP